MKGKRLTNSTNPSERLSPILNEYFDEIAKLIDVPPTGSYIAALREAVAVNETMFMLIDRSEPRPTEDPFDFVRCLREWSGQAHA